ncbi:MAG TPA: response regulator [Gemmatimonadaceae bacterium]
MALATESRAKSQRATEWRPFVVLLVGHSDLRARSLDSALESTGYAVVHADSGFQAMELTYSVRPDAIVVGEHVAGLSGVELCRHLTGSPRFSPATPVILTTAEGSTRADRLEAFSAGAWATCTEPLDSAILLLKLQTFIRARRVGERLREGTLYDGATGLYNIDGLLLRAREIGAAAVRRREPLACVAFTPHGISELNSGAAVLDTGDIDSVATTCRQNIRASDVLGRPGIGEFVIVAPCTAEGGARTLVARLQHALGVDARGTASSSGARVLRTSICAADDFRESGFGGVEMLMQAISGLHILT